MRRRVCKHCATGARATAGSAGQAVMELVACVARSDCKKRIFDDGSSMGLFGWDLDGTSWCSFFILILLYLPGMSSVGPRWDFGWDSGCVPRWDSGWYLDVFSMSFIFNKL